MTGSAVESRPFRLGSTWTRRGLLAAAVVVLVLLMAFVAPQWKVKSIDETEVTSAVVGSQNLDPVKYVDSVWEEKLLPTVKSDALELAPLLDDLRTNRAQTVKQHGHTTSLGGSPAFLVTGEGRIVSVDTKSLISTAGVSLDGDAKPDMFFQIGPIVSGTDIRDAVGFIDFNQFVNQVQFEEVGVEINSRIRDTVLSKLDPTKLKGKQVAFSGAFTYSDPKSIVVMPVTLEVSK